MFQVFSATDSRENDYGEGFGNYWQMDATSRELLNNVKSIAKKTLSSSMLTILDLNDRFTLL